jgi:hypothetical protein
MRDPPRNFRGIVSSQSTTFLVRGRVTHDRFDAVINHARRATFRAGVLALLLVGACLTACSTTDSATAAGPSCTNGTKDDGEEGLDCGGVCPLKCTGAVCAVNTDCGSGQCNMSACAAPAGKTCGVGAPIPQCNEGDTCELDKDCTSGFCSGNKCATPAAGSHSDGIKNGGETGVDCGGSVKAAQPCPDGQGCMDSTDCVGTCTAGICGPISHMDGKKNLDETDVDCGGATAPKCVDGKDCAADADCATGYCPTDTKKCIAPTYSDGVLNGTETDLDCGGTGMGFKACAQGLNCKVDTDCNGACNYLKKCTDAPSCKNQHGGTTCGTGEFMNPDPTAAPPGHVVAGGTVVAGHEDCCRTLEVKGFTDPVMPAGKTKVYLDKYEITAGRMRAFLEAIGGGVDAAGNAKDANIRAWMAAHRPARWEPGWEEVLPTANDNSVVNYTVSRPTVNMLYPGQDQFIANHPTQAGNGWWIGNANVEQAVGQDLPRTIDVGVFWALGAQYFFPEYHANAPPWPSTEYAASHALNCANTDNSFGYSTYWFDQATIAAHLGGTQGKYFSKADLDEKALNCSPNALFAAFCVWDGGQLATAEVMDRVTGNSLSPIYDAGACQGGAACQNGKIAAGMSTCGGTPHKYITYPDGGSVPCADVYYYPNDNGHDYFDGSSRIAPPGRVTADLISDAAADEPWMDLIGNLQEVVYKKGETKRFDYRGYGTEWSSIQHHHNQQTTPRNKGGSLGARCMRFK